MSKPKPAPLPSGTVVGGYTVVKKLAAGGFGVVYLAEGENQQLVAVKEYLPASLAERSAGELTPRVKPDKQPLYRLGGARWRKSATPASSACSTSSARTKPFTW